MRADLRTEVRIYLVEVSRPVTCAHTQRRVQEQAAPSRVALLVGTPTVVTRAVPVVAPGDLLDDWRDPDRIEPHARDVV